ncbi:MAG: amidohydrolase [Prevotellaceae bacterium]|jgi:hippurate hydrolase|nr:amidohydrolase [Prevotellaceae bacterium]
MKAKIKTLSNEAFPFVCEAYKHLHAHPELSFEEVETAKFIQAKLAEMNIPFRANIGGTGVLGVLKGRNPEKKIIALRADMDALPVDEETDLSYKSTCRHRMHACGHDAHVASLLGTAKILSALKNEWEGTVLLVFQPGEEKHPGGARLMLEDGVFAEYKPELIIGQHASVDYPVGTVAFRGGTIMASADEIYLNIHGKGGHAALPHLFNDTVLCAAQILVSLQQIKSRLNNPFSPMVLSFGRFIADSACNVIPNTVQLSGTLRTMNEQWRAEAKEHIRRIATETAKAYGCSCDVQPQDGYPTVDNDPQLTEQLAAYAAEFLGSDRVRTLEVRMTGEDFGFFTQQYPASFYRFGIRGASNLHCGGLHTSTFVVDLEAFRTSAGTMAWLAWKSLL